MTLVGISDAALSLWKADKRSLTDIEPDKVGRKGQRCCFLLWHYRRCQLYMGCPESPLKNWGFFLPFIQTDMEDAPFAISRYLHLLGKSFRLHSWELTMVGKILSIKVRQQKQVKNLEGNKTLPSQSLVPHQGASPTAGAQRGEGDCLTPTHWCKLGEKCSDNPGGG